MSSLMIRLYSMKEDSTEEELGISIMVPLEIFHIVAKHIPDQILRFVYDYKNPDKGSTAVNLHTIASTINNVLQEIEAERKVGALNGVIAEFVFEPDETKESLEAAKKEMERLKVVFSVEDSPTAFAN